jgi:1,4-alpha-glucan branching enzyme
MKKITVILFTSVALCISASVSLAQILSNEPYPPQYGKPFKDVPDRRDVTMYQVNMRSFSKNGDLKGVTVRLDSIKALGVNVIYLMPVYPVGTLKSVNSPYATRNYDSVGTEFGTIGRSACACRWCP